MNGVSKKMENLKQTKFKTNNGKTIYIKSEMGRFDTTIYTYVIKTKQQVMANTKKPTYKSVPAIREVDPAEATELFEMNPEFFKGYRQAKVREQKEIFEKLSKIKMQIEDKKYIVGYNILGTGTIILEVYEPSSYTGKHSTIRTIVERVYGKVKEAEIQEIILKNIPEIENLNWNFDDTMKRIEVQF